MQIYLRAVIRMIFRGTWLLPMLVAGAAALSFPSCSAKVGQFEVLHGTESANPGATTTSETTTTTTTTALVYRGNIYDTNLKLVTYGTYAKGEDDERIYGENCAYSFSNLISEASNGLDESLRELLTSVNPTKIAADHEVGRSVRLTIDSDVQTELCSYMANMGMSGSIVVLRTDGSILAEVSYPNYDPELYFSDEEYRNLLWSGALENKAFMNASPGSCFKIMSEVIADKNNITCLYDDGEWFDSGATIVNWDHDIGGYPIPERTLYSAFVNSSNIFFAKVYDQLGTDKVLDELNRLFHFCDPINCDFGSIENQIKIECLDDLRRSAFGQSHVKTCPIYLAALGREAVFGDMVKPFIVQQVVDTSDPSKECSKGTSPYEVIASIPEEYRQNLLDCMTGVANNLGIYVPENYQFYAKTGTAETGRGDFLYITGCLRNVADRTNEKIKYTDYSNYGLDGSYIIVMQLQNPADFGFDFASQTGYLYQGIINTVLSY